MDKQTFHQIESYMLHCMQDSAHDAEHVYRVMYNALDIAADEPCVDYEVLLAACLLHDIGRARQFESPKLCHAKEGGYIALKYLLDIGFPSDKAEHVKNCIVSHRYRNDAQPCTIEAKILFDADKIDVTGALGVARTLFYQGHVGTALYTLNDDGDISDGTSEDGASFFHEYNYKLKRVYDGFYTHKGEEIAKERRQAMEDYYNRLFSEITENRQKGKERLAGILENERLPLPLQDYMNADDKSTGMQEAEIYVG